MFKNRFYTGDNSSSSEENDGDTPQINVQKPNLLEKWFHSNSDSDEEEIQHPVGNIKGKRSKENHVNLSTAQPLEQFLSKKKSTTEKETLPRHTKSPKKPEQSQPSDNITVNDDPQIEDITDASILKKLNEILSKRSKREINYQDQFECLEQLREHVIEQNLNVDSLIQILIAQITLGFDFQQRKNESSKSTMWTRTLNQIEELLSYSTENINRNDEIILPIIIQMDKTFMEILRDIDVHSQEYIDRLKDESRISSILDHFKIHLECIDSSNDKVSENLCVINLHLIEHVYYKYDATPEQPSIQLINHLCKFICNHDQSKYSFYRAILCQIYHLSLHNLYYQARNLMLMYHLQDMIHSLDISTQILYNRTMIQLGLCAFRSGEIHEAHQALVDIQCRNRIKDLLGQDDENREHLYPFHMHINLQLIECVYYISAMLIEIPSVRKHRISKYFHILMSQAENQTIIGPPESMRDHIVAACHALKESNWYECVNFLINDCMNQKVWKSMPQNTELFKMLIDKIKEASLRIYLLTYATVFNDISILTLVHMFELSSQQVNSMIAKMIIDRELMGSIDKSTEFIIMHETKSSRTAELSYELMEKLSKLYEQNEKLNRFLLRTVNNF
ncbi:hypothetical protein I4U23_012932 [Adineta vaga]|nr:hypothetical protein I4U23_012932 [Adineta vaga]